MEGYLSQVLQRRKNHETFELIRVGVIAHPELAQKFAISEVPTILVVAEQRVRVRLEGPRSRQELEDALSPWLV
jgi:thioredoxin-like negative regulator of GroEL